MKVLSNKRQISNRKNGDLVSSKRCATRKIAADPPKKKRGPKGTSKLEPANISAQRCVLHDKTNTFTTNVKSSAHTPVGYQKSENSGLRSQTNLAMSRRNLSNSYSSNQKQTNDTMKKGETTQKEANSDVYEFVLDDGEVNENKPKTKKQSKRKRVQRKIIDSPEEVLPAKKIRKPLQDKVSKNLIPKGNQKNKFWSGESKFSSAKFFSGVSHPSKMKTVHFNNPSGNEIVKPISGMELKLCTPKGGAKNISSSENVQTHTKTNVKGSTPNILTSLNPSSQGKSVKCTTERSQLCSPSECNRQNLRPKENEIRKLLSFFSPPRTAGNSGTSYSVPVTEKTPAKQVACQSCNTETNNIEISNSENVQPSSPSDETEQQCDKMQKTLDLSNCFGFDDDVDSEDEDFSPVKTFTKSSQKLGKFHCSTPKEVGQKNGVSQPFRFPTLSIVKRRNFLQTAGNTPATVTNLNRKTAPSGSTLKRECGIPVSSPVKESSRPAIFDLEDEVHECQGDDKYESEHQQDQRKPKDCEASSPQKKVLQKSYGTPRHQTRLRRPLHDEVKEDSSEDEAEEVLKKHKKTHRPTKTKAVDEWAKCFNSMCETIDSFELIVE